MRKMLIAAILLVLMVGTIHLHLAGATPTPDETAFYRLWERTDAPVQNNHVERTWYWGPSPLQTLDEPYVEGYNGARRVQYWDKGRMEISNPNEAATSAWYVTAGLLPLEMISGKVQLGDSTFEDRTPAIVPIAGDPNPDNPFAPTYASFAGVTTSPSNNHGQTMASNGDGHGLSGARAPERYGELVAETLDFDGTVGRRPDLATAYPGTRLVHYDGTLGHNIPEVFLNFLQQVGKIQINGEERTDLLVDWNYVMGHPASEPYWIRTKIGGVEQDALVQVFERRVLTYHPSNPLGWQVEMGNVGQHYQKWRYGMVEPINRPAPVIYRPNNFTADVEPQAGLSGTDFLVTLYGFQGEETVSVWVTLPDQTVIPAPELGIADSTGRVQLMGAAPFLITTNEGDPSGVWAVSGRGNRSGRTAVAYFTVEPGPLIQQEK